MNLTLVSFIGLAILFLSSQFTSHVLGIFSSRFYMPFHFVGGMLSMTFLYSLFQNFLLALAATFLVGVVWELYEYLLWKYFLKREGFRPHRRDTIIDIVLDMAGALIAIPFLTS